MTSTNKEEEDRKMFVVQLYHRDNYHWYLKLELQNYFLLGFDTETPGRVLISRSGEVVVLDTVWDVCVNSFSKDSSIAVIDGRQLLLTPLGKP